MFSEVLGSFIRTGNFPLEANYIFNSLQELNEFYNDPINKTTLHEGLLKIVLENGKQSLYWAVNRGTSEFPEFEFIKILDNFTIPKLEDKINNIQGGPGGQGADGKSAYQIWLEEGNTGTISEFLESLKGAPFTYNDFTEEQLESLKGPQGPQGPQGPPGACGEGAGYNISTNPDNILALKDENTLEVIQDLTKVYYNGSALLDNIEYEFGWHEG